MLHTLYIVLALIAVVCFLAAAVLAVRRSAPRDSVGYAVALVAVGLAAWSLVDLVQLIRTA